MSRFVDILYEIEGWDKESEPSKTPVSDQFNEFFERVINNKKNNKGPGMIKIGPGRYRSKVTPY